MTAIRGIVNGGRLELDVPVSWTDGTEVVIQPIVQFAEDALSPDEIASTLAAMDGIEPFEITDAEQAAYDAERRSRKEWEKSQFFTHADECGE